MKRSRIFMGMAALGVAAFGAFAFTSKTSSSISAFYKPGGVGCESAEITVECEPHDDGGCLAPSGPAAGQQLYNMDCQQELRPEPTFR